MRNHGFDQETIKETLYTVQRAPLGTTLLLKHTLRKP